MLTLSCDRCGADLYCRSCGTAVHRVPDTTGREWIEVATRTEMRRSPTPLNGHLGEPIYPEFEVFAGSAVARNAVPSVHPHIRAKFVASIGEQRTQGWEAVNYGHAIPADPVWFALFHCHTSRECPCGKPLPYDVPECCGWPMHLSPIGWQCRIERGGHAQ